MNPGADHRPDLEALAGQHAGLAAGFQLSGGRGDRSPGADVRGAVLLAITFLVNVVGLAIQQYTMRKFEGAK